MREEISGGSSGGDKIYFNFKLSDCARVLINYKAFSTRVKTRLTAVLLVLSLSTVVLSVAAEDARDAAAGVGAFELTG